MSEGRVLLPSNVKPVLYDITLTPDLEKFTFSGHESITVSVTSETNSIEVHALEIEFQEVYLIMDNVEVKCDRHVLNKETESVTFHFSKPVTIGTHTLFIEFTGILNDSMAGFYRSKYQINGEEKYCAVTQFEPADCRKAFPSFDEPALKAEFVIRLLVNKELTALSNMPVQSQKIEGDKILYSYKKTPVMSTYLVAFVIGEFDYIEGTTTKGVNVRVFTEVGKTEQGQFALDCGLKILDFYTDYFDIGYPLEKCDMIAISDFSAGAMENWGLITYRETALLIDEKSSSLASKQRVAYVVAHELAHQWFGNLVTMDWWQDLWLNEGFATWVGNLAVDFLFKEWDIWTQFVQQYVSRAMDLDALATSHPIEVDVKKSSEINEIFDAISYCKGASVILMLADYIGLDAFQKGLQVYLKRHQYKNAATKDLWEALGESSNQDVSSFMRKWTREIGYPIVTVNRPENGKLTVKQERFLSTGEKVTENSPWAISLSVCGEKNSFVHHQTITSFEDTVTLPEELVNSKWLKINVGTSGFYRVKYDDNMLKALGEAVESKSLATVDRLSLVNDAFALSKAGWLSIDKVLELISKYTNETDYTVWAEIASNIDQLSVVFSDHESMDDLKSYVRKLFSNIVNVVGWEPKEGENALYSLLRPIVLKTVGGCKDEVIIAEAQKRFADFQKDNGSLSPDLRGCVYSIVVGNGGRDEYEAVKQVFETAEMHEEKIRALSSLGATKDLDLINELLSMTDTDAVRSSDKFFVYATLSGSKVGRPIAWQHMKDNFEAFMTQFGSGQFLFARMIGSATKNFSSKERKQEIEEFFNNNPVDQAARTIGQSLESIESNAAWIQRENENLAAFFKN